MSRAQTYPRARIIVTGKDLYIKFFFFDEDEHKSAVCQYRFGIVECKWRGGAVRMILVEFGSIAVRLLVCVLFHIFAERNLQPRDVVVCGCRSLMKA